MFGALQERPLNSCALWIIDNVIVRRTLDVETEIVMFYASRKHLANEIKFSYCYVEVGSWIWSLEHCKCSRSRKLLVTCGRVVKV